MPLFDVSLASPHELLPACRLLFPGRAELSRDRISAEAGAGLFVARADGKVRAAVLMQALPGALGVAWAPRGDSTEAVDAVTLTACEWLRSRGVKVCQAFATAGEAADMVPLERTGFRHTTQLVSMRSDGFDGYGANCPLTFTSDGLPYSTEFATALLATHEHTRDCPELNAPRSPSEILAGFGAPSGEAYLAWSGDAHVGVVMLEYPTTTDAAELAYLGVVPTARGRGFGAELLTFAANEAAASGRFALNVSVDARNAPAMRLYARHGFVEYDRREVWLLTQLG